MFRTSVLGGTAVALLASSAAFAGDVEWFPPDPPNSAMAGECYARIRIDAEYDQHIETVVTQDAYERYDVLPPRLREELREYISREAGVRYVVTEPVYETVTETVQVRPAYVEYEVQPAVHDTVTETILVREPRMVWRRGYVEGAHQTRFDSETGEVWCLVEEEGEYRQVTRNIVVQPAQIREVEYPAEYAEITREVLVQEATVRTVPIEEQTASYRVQVVDQHASVDSRTIQRETTDVTRYTLRSEERYEWRLVDCSDIDVPEHTPSYGQHPPVASNRSAPSSNTYLYGTDMPVQGDSHADEVPVAQASYSAYARSTRSSRTQ